MVRVVFKPTFAIGFQPLHTCSSSSVFCGRRPIRFLACSSAVLGFALEVALGFAAALSSSMMEGSSGSFTDFLMGSSFLQ